MIKEIQTRVQQYFDLPKNGIGAELGVARGYNSIHLYHITKPSKMYLVDTWLNDFPYTFGMDPSLWNGPNKRIVENVFAEELGSGKVSIYNGYTSSFLNTLEDDYLDWIYIDADHRYDGARVDIRKAYDKVKPNGIVAGHDFMVHPEAWKSGVIRALTEMLQEGKLTMESISAESNASYICRVNK